MGKLLRTYPYVITSHYGNRGNSFHGGVDIVGNNGSYNVLDYICAKDKGTVIAVRKDSTGFEAGGSYGNYVIIDHGSGYKTVYAHMAYGSVCVNVGDVIKEGQVIGYMGNTGTSYGGHLHFEVRHNNQRIDPTPYLDQELPLVVIPKKSIDEVAKDVIAGKYGNYPERKERLEAEGYNYNEVQARVDEMLKPATEGFKIGDVVVPVQLVDYYGTYLVQYDSSYVITDLNGNRAVLSAVRNGNKYIWAAMNTNNIKKI